MEFKDYYATLGVNRKSSQDDIQKAYRKLARKFHPDVNNNNPQAEEKFKEISEAYEVLKDDKKRSTYDRYGAAWKDAARSGGGAPGGFDIKFDFGDGGRGGFGGSGFSSFFDMLFGNRGGGGGSPFGQGSPFGGGAGGWPGGAGGGRAPRGQDQEAKIALTIEEAAQGGQREITVADMVGRSRSYSVTIPPGIKPGQQIRLQGRGQPAVGGGPAGDLYLQVDFKPHDRFRLEGIDLHTVLQVSPWEAALGGEVPIKTLDGTLKVRIPAGSSSGRRIRLRGKGFPARERSGDLYAEIRVMIPGKLSERERELFEELARESSFKAR